MYIQEKQGFSRSSFSTELFYGFWRAIIAKTLVELELPAYLINERKTVAELAEATKIRPDLLYRFLRAAASCQLISEELTTAEIPQKIFTSSEITESLCPGQPLYFLIGHQLAWFRINSWNRLADRLRTDKRVMDTILSMPFWEYLNTHPQENRFFDGAMTVLSNTINPLLVKAYSDFSLAETVVDVGGGQGHFLRTILQENPTVNGILFDRELTIDQAREQIKDAGLSDRCTCISGDFLDEIPGGGSIYTLKGVLHDWNDEQCLRILHNVRKSARNGAKVLILDVVIPETSPPSFFLTSYLDLEMLCALDGKVRTVEELTYLLEQSDFTLERVIPVDRTGHYILEGQVSA